MDNPVITAIDRAAKKCGGVSQLAQALGIAQSAVSNWKKRGTRIDPDLCSAIECKTDGEVRCEELNPEAPWHRIPDPAWPHPDGRPVADYAGRHLAISAPTPTAPAPAPAATQQAA